jgi:hypothetical protein
VCGGISPEKWFRAIEYSCSVPVLLNWLGKGPVNWFPLKSLHFNTNLGHQILRTWFHRYSNWKFLNTRNTSVLLFNHLDSTPFMILTCRDLKYLLKLQNGYFTRTESRLFPEPEFSQFKRCSQLQKVLERWKLSWDLSIEAIVMEVPAM